MGIAGGIGEVHLAYCGTMGSENHDAALMLAAKSTSATEVHVTV